MRRRLIALSVLACACARPTAPAATAAPPALSLEPLVPGVWRHVSWEVVPGWGLFSSNGLVVAVDGGAALVDTAWGAASTRALLDTIEADLERRVLAAVVTHAHDDRLGGGAVLGDRGVPVHAGVRTRADAPARGLSVPPGATLADDDAVEVGGVRLETFFPGAGHTRDNVVVHLPGAGVVFGGCLVRDADAEGLGNLADADLGAWAASVDAVARRFPEASVVVPGHGAPGGRALLDHTIALATAASSPAP